MELHPGRQTKLFDQCHRVVELPVSRCNQFSISLQSIHLVQLSGGFCLVWGAMVVELRRDLACAL
eukprot:5377767-Amphidinium_carterae.1